MNKSKKFQVVVWTGLKIRDKIWGKACCVDKPNVQIRIIVIY